MPPESARAREFRNIAHRIAAGNASASDVRQARQWLTLWLDTDAALQPLLRQSALTAELAPLSQNLSQAASIGLAALDALEKYHPVTDAWRQSQLATLKQMEAPQAVLLNMIVPGVEELVATHETLAC